MCAKFSQALAQTMRASADDQEIRIIVKPEEIDDLGAINLCKQIARKVEDNLEYPGQIKVTVIRETRAVEHAK